MIHESRSPPGSYLDLASSSRNSNVVFLARFPRRLGRPYSTSSTLSSLRWCPSLLRSSAADDELIDVWLLASGLSIARRASRSKGADWAPKWAWLAGLGPLRPSQLPPSPGVGSRVFKILSPSACGPLSSVSLRIG
jgi:hypothetical protein